MGWFPQSLLPPTPISVYYACLHVYRHMCICVSMSVIINSFLLVHGAVSIKPRAHGYD